MREMPATEAGPESGGAFQPLEKDVILNVVLAALHSHKDLAARQSTNRLLHDADARGGLAQAFAELAAHGRRKDIRDATAERLQGLQGLALGQGIARKPRYELGERWH